MKLKVTRTLQGFKLFDFHFKEYFLSTHMLVALKTVLNFGSVTKTKQNAIKSQIYVHFELF